MVLEFEEKELVDVNVGADVPWLIEKLGVCPACGRRVAGVETRLGCT
jgi:hypothetical protein